MESNVMYFEEYKFFKTKFKFRNKEEYNELFNEALILSPFRFLTLTEQEYDERLHIVWSWKEFFKYAVYGFIAISFILIFKSFPFWLGVTPLILSILSLSFQKFLETKLEDLNFRKSETLELYQMDNFASMEEVRKELIKEKKQREKNKKLQN